MQLIKKKTDGTPSPPGILDCDPAQPGQLEGIHGAPRPPFGPIGKHPDDTVGRCFSAGNLLQIGENS